MFAPQRDQLRRLCSSSETFEKAQSLLLLANAKTGPGSGFVVKNPVAIPAVCAYLASEQLNTGEVSLQSAMVAACVTKTEFTEILRKVGTAIHIDQGNNITNITYETLVDTYHIHPRDDVIACMEDIEAALPRADIVKERYGANAFSCAVFYWLCQLLEEPSVRDRSLRQTYSIQPKSFKAIVTTLDKHCDGIVEQIKSHLLPKRCSVPISTSQQSPVPKLAPSPPKSPTKSAQRPRTMTRQTSTPTMTPSRKRTVAFSRLSADHDDSTSFPETPTKKRRIERTASPTKPSTSSSPTKSLVADTAAFDAAIRGSPTKVSAPVAGPSTPRRPRHTKAVEFAVTPVQADSQPSPSRSQGQASPIRPPVRRRFRPVFLEQQQWCARDPKVERMWAAAEKVRNEMGGQSFQRIERREDAVVAV